MYRLLLLFTNLSLSVWIFHIVFLLSNALEYSSQDLRKNEIANPSANSKPKLKESGQIIRLRGVPRTVGEGRLEVYKDGRWGTVCDKNVNTTSANVVCKSLGFVRGATDVKHSSFYGGGNLHNLALDNLICTGDETNFQQCKQEKTKRSRCSAISDTVGVKCRQNYISKCRLGGILFNEICYYFHHESKRMFDAASAECQQLDGGSLAVIRSQEENDFLSEALFAIDGDTYQNSWYIGGQRSDNVWQWKTLYSMKSSIFTKWKFDFTDRKENNCMVLKRSFSTTSENDYYFWDTVPCNTYENFICQEFPLDIGCRNGSGREYVGQANVTENGTPCIPWNSPSVLERGEIFPGQKTWNHNFCRNPEGDKFPWCLTKDGTSSFCDIEPCGTRNTSGICRPDEIQCKNSRVCLSQDFLCDGEKDCPDNSDEKNCSNPCGPRDTSHELICVLDFVRYLGICGRRFIEPFAQDEDVRKPKVARIVGGFEAIPGAYPWTAALRIKPDEKHHCGAAVITDKYLLTAAHCIDTKRKTNDYEVVVGEWNTEGNEGTEQNFDVQDIIIHPSFIDLKKDDLALLRIKEKNGRGMIFTNYVQPVCLPKETTSYTQDLKCYVSGWGSTGTGIDHPKKLQAALIPIMSRNECTNPKIYGPNLAQSVFCAGYTNGGVDSCVGDSGGPFACDINGKYTLLGLVSWGDGCAERNKPGVYSKIVDYLDWIKKNIQN